MKFIVKRASLKEAVDWVSRSGKAPGTLVHVTVGSDRVTLEGSDSEYWLKTDVHVESVLEQGEFYTPIGQFASMLGGLGDALVELSMDEASSHIIGTCGRATFSLGVALEPDQWRDTPELSPVATVDREQAIWALRSAANVMASPSDRGKERFQGVRVTVKGGEISFSSTNGYRVILTAIGAQADADFTTFIRPATALDALGVISAKEATFVTSEEGLFGVADGTTSSLGLPLAAVPPPWEKILTPGRSLAEGMALDLDELQSGINLAQLTREMHFRVEPTGDEAYVSSQPVNGVPASQSSGRMAIPMMGDAIPPFTAAYESLKPILSAVRTDTIIMRRPAGAGPQQTTPVYVYEDDTAEGGTRMEAVFMPIKDGSAGR